MLLRLNQAAPRSCATLRASSPRSSLNCARSHASSSVYTRSYRLARPSRLGLQVWKAPSTSLRRYQSGTASPFDHINRKDEVRIEKEKLNVEPDQVSTTSSVHALFHEKGVADPEADVDMLAGVKSDLKTIKETFALEEVPRQALFVGVAGVVPYLATSLSTVFLAWDINHASEDGQGFLLSGPNAEALLAIIEPLQIGYGAVLISFLGAIHWGFEWAKYGGEVGYRRYAYGIVATAVAWPTIAFPVEYALIAQFTAFTFLYFADSRAVVRGWAPHWYATYRFVLTFIVGASIVVSLIGRGQIADKLNRMPSPMDRVKKIREGQLDAIEAEERYKRDHIVAEDEGEDDEEDAEDDGEEAADGEEDDEE